MFFSGNNLNICACSRIHTFLCIYLILTFRLSFYEKDLHAYNSGMISRDTRGRKWAQIQSKGPPTLMILITISLKLLWFRYFSLLFPYSALEMCFKAMKKERIERSFRVNLWMF